MSRPKKNSKCPFAENGLTQMIEGYRAVWDNKSVLRTIYEDYYGRIVRRCRPGLTLEIGGGIGNFKKLHGNIVSSDIQYSNRLDVVADAQSLPFCSNSFDNIVMFDVLHHIQYPILFFKDACRILKRGGRIIAMEPAITYGSVLFYRFFHHEPVCTSADPLADGTPDASKNPYDSNQAIPTLLVTRDLQRLRSALPDLVLHDLEWISLLAYPLSGGFKQWSLLSNGMAKRLLKIEHPLERLLGRYLAFRLLLTFEKRDVSAG